MPAPLWAARAEMPPADQPPHREVAQWGRRRYSWGDEILGISGARLGTDLQLGWGFTRGNSNPFILTVPGMSRGEKDAEGQQRGWGAAHPSG